MNLDFTPSSLIKMVSHWISREHSNGNIKPMIAPFIWGAPGIGKAQPLDSKILTPDGWTTMGDITVGATVYAYDGSRSKVLGVYPQGTLDIYEVQFADGRTVECCDQHLWNVWVCRHRSRGWETLRTCDIRHRMEHNTGAAAIHHVPLVSKFINKSDAPLPIHPYVLGALIGDGSIGNNGIRFTSNDQEIVNKIASHLPVGTVVSNQPHHPLAYGIVTKRGETNPTLNHLRALGLAGSVANTKFIPPIYLNTNHEMKHQLLQGLMDTDGTVSSSGSLSYCTTSEQLAHDVQQLVWSLGGIASITPKFPTYAYQNEKRRGQIAYTVNIRISKQSDFVSLSRKRDNLSENYQYSDLRLKIESITYIGKKPAQCIMIDHHQHLYVTDNFIVTHNTDLVRDIAKMMSCRIVAMHLPQYDPNDLKGIPIMGDDGQVKWMPTSYLPQQHRVRVDTETDYTAELQWQYATDIAVYLLDQDGNEIVTHNDPSRTDSNNANVVINNPERGKWTVSVSDFPIDAYEMVIVDKAIIFLDELSAADHGTQKAALQLVLDRRVGEYDVPMGVPIIAAGNREGDGAFIQPLSDPLANRFQHATLVPSVDDFIEWGMFNNVRPEILGYVKAFPDGLFNYDPSALGEGEYGFSTPRSLVMLSQQYEDIEFYTDMANGDELEGLRLRLASFAGLIGKTDASTLTGYIEIMHELPSVEDITSGSVTELPNVERSKSFGILYSLLQNMKRIHDKCNIKELSKDEHPVEWTQGRDNILDFITNNFSKETGTWAGTMMFQQMKFTSSALRSTAGLRFTDKFVNIMTQVGRVRR